MNIQFHLTDACNHRCTHCYQNQYENSLLSLIDFEKIIYGAEEYSQKQNEFLFVSAITGGEPFLLDNLDKYMEIAGKHFESLRILSNGSLLTTEKINQLKKATDKISHLQFSLEGPKEVNDRIRGKGSFQEVINAIKISKEADMPCAISYTLAPYNYDKVPELYNSLLEYEYTPNAIWFDRCIPFKEAGVLTKEQFGIFLKDLKALRIRWKEEHLPIIPRKIRSLQFLCNQDKPVPIYSCGAGTAHFTVMPNGDLMICRRLNTVVGNVLEESWNTVIQRITPEIEQIHQCPDECLECKYHEICSGGLKCLTYHQFGDYNHKDINCIL